MRETPAARIPPQAGMDSSTTIANERGRSMEEHSVAFDWLQLASVTGVETNEDGRWTGFVTVQLLTIEGTRDKVKLAFPAAGNGVFSGGPPEVGSVVVLGWLPAGRPVVLGQIPFSIEALYQKKALPDLAQGELLIRSGNAVEGEGRVGGASILWDRDGRVIIQDREQRMEVTVGPVYDQNDVVEKNPQTGDEIRLRVQAKDANGVTLMSLRLDDGGNVLLEANRVDILSPEVNVGEDTNDRDRLVTRGGVEDVCKLHTHATAGTGAPSPPTIVAGETGYTEQLRSK